MKRISIVLCLIGQLCFGQELAPQERQILVRAAQSVMKAQKVLIVFERSKDQPPGSVAEFSDEKWQLKFAESMGPWEATPFAVHIFGFNDPTLIIKESGVVVDFPRRGLFQIAIDDGKSREQLALEIPVERWDMMLAMINEKRANQALLPTTTAVTPAASHPPRQP